MTRIEGDWIGKPETQAVFDALEAGGHRAYFVGGCVRNALLGQPVSDIDISTDAVPQEVMRLTGAAGLKPVPTGVDHGTVTVVSGHEGHEVTTFRRDVETDGRRAVVAYSTELLDDARRRDFTMNALYADRTGAVIDPLEQGLEDLAARRVRFIENAEARIREDYLRILRFFRFHAWYGHAEDGIDPEALAPIAENSAGIETLSRERMGHEMLRLLAAADPSPSLAAMQATGVLAKVIPGADARFVAPLVHHEAEAGLGPDAIRRLAALGGEDAAGHLKLSRADARRLALLAEEAAGSRGTAELAYRQGAGTALDIEALRAAFSGTPLPKDISDKAETGARARFPVKAVDLLPDHSGPDLGRRLSRLERAWIASGFTLSREALLRLE